MKISTKGRYALRMMIDLAQHSDSGYVALKDIAKRQGISKKYLEQIVPLLNSADFLQTNRGYQGGYMLAKPPEQYTVGDILRTTEGGIAPISCLERNSVKCERSDECMTLSMWKGLYKVMTDYLDNITLQDIINNYNDSNFDNYSI